MVHTFSVLGVNVAVDVNSGAVHVLDSNAYEALNLLLKTQGDTPDFSVRPAGMGEEWEELKALADEGLLFTNDDYIEPSVAANVQKGSPIKALCLHVSHDCNLRCRYCFASTGDFGTGHRLTMDFETAKRAIDFVIEKSGSRRNIEVDFFGGEPLMAMDTVKKTVAYARSIEEEHGKCFRFTITTNGVLLDDENIAYINKEMSNAVLSLDGRPAVNDHMRKTINGKGSYDMIVPKFKQLVDGRGDKDYYLRGTFTHNNLDFAADVTHVASLGFRNISVEPVVSEPECSWALQDDDIPTILAEYEKLAEELKGRDDINFFHFNVDLAQGPCVIKRMRGCGAGCEYVAVTPEGDLYPCHQFVGNAEYKLGNVFEGTFDHTLSDKFAELNIYTREDCKTCWARFYCSGGCSASNLLVNGDIKKPHHVGCELEKKRLECAIALRALAAAKES
ncbi:MAG: thioether cross-link-forming SCIFF peptide maturase [Oscillospiraceae bacterium]